MRLHLKGPGLRLKAFLVAGLTLLYAGGCDLGCDVDLSETCLFGHYCPSTDTCSLCCSDTDCTPPRVCHNGGCQDYCATKRCECGFLDLGCQVVECCLGEPGCECCSDRDCAAGQACRTGVAEGGEPGQLCYTPCLGEGEECAEGGPACCQGLTCHPAESTCVPACELDEDCWTGEERFAADRVCERQICVFVACLADDECLEHQSCFEGLCLSPADCAWLTYCAITPDPVELGPGEQVQLTAEARMRDHQAAPVAGFGWTSDDPAVVSVETDGWITAGPAAGRAMVTAAVLGCQVTCSVAVDVVDR